MSAECPAFVLGTENAHDPVHRTSELAAVGNIENGRAYFDGDH